MTEALRPEESTIVQLTRMEGILNVIAERGKHTADRVDEHSGELRVIRVDIDNLQSDTQTLKEGAIAEEKTKIALAIALKDADESRRKKSEQTWTPFQRGILLLAGLTSAVSLYLALFPPTLNL